MIGAKSIILWIISIVAFVYFMIREGGLKVQMPTSTVLTYKI